MLSFMHAQYTFFQQGYSLLHELDPYMKKLATEVRDGELWLTQSISSPLPREDVLIPVQLLDLVIGECGQSITRSRVPV